VSQKVNDMLGNLKADASRIALSFVRAFASAITLTNILNIHDTRGWTSVLASAAIAGGAAALRTLESLLSPSLYVTAADEEDTPAA